MGPKKDKKASQKKNESKDSGDQKQSKTSQKKKRTLMPLRIEMSSK